MKEVQSGRDGVVPVPTARIFRGRNLAMGSSSVRERIAIVFMTLSVVATLVLGGALAAQLGHPRQQVVQVGAASAASPEGGVSAGFRRRARRA